MSNWLQSAEDAIKGAYCSYLGVVDNYFGFWQSLGVPTDRVNPELRSYVCDEPGPAPPPPDFTGGQCPCSRYDVNFGWDSGGGFAQQGDLTLDGPIFGSTIQNDDAFIDHGAPACGGRRLTRAATGLNQSAQNSFQIISAIALFGDPDDCGDPEPSIPPLPPGGTTVPISFTYVDNSSNNINVSADLTIFAPIFAPVGIFAPRIVVPIRLVGPNFEFSGNINLPDLNIDINPSFGQPGSGDPQPDLPDEPDTPDTPTTPEDDNRRTLVGVIVRSQQIGELRTTSISQPTGPDLYVPRLANVHFRVRLGSRLSWLGPYDVKYRDTFVPVPPEITAVSARVDAEQGWQSEGTLVFKSSTSEP